MLSFPKAFLALGLLSVANLAQAAIIELNADHFSVTYETDQLGPYAQGIVSDSQDTVYFNSNSFKATAPGAQGVASVLLRLTLTIDPGYTFAGLSFTERGNYYLYGDGAVNVETVVTLADLATPDSAVLNLATGSSLDVIQQLTLWELGGVLGPVGPDAPQTLMITLDSTLFSSASAGLAFIQNTYAGFQVMTEPAAVPEPSSWALLLAGILAALLVGRRKVHTPSWHAAVSGSVKA